MPAEIQLFEHVPQAEAGRATLTVEAAKPAAHRVNPWLYGKFTEHLGANIYHGIEAQILRNPTFGKWRFGAGESQTDGGVQGEYDPEKIARRIQGSAAHQGLPDAGPLIESYRDGLAFGWFRLGSREAVRVSPDVGPYGGRAQRVEIVGAKAEGTGIAQWTYLPLHRTRGYVFRVVARASEACEAELSLARVEAGGKAGETLARARIALQPQWTTLTGRLEVPAADLKPEALHRFAVTLNARANVVFGRVLLYPDDHVGFADPDVIRFLKEARLPLMRWPGGNFVSGYRWREGVGPVDARPTVPNPAWEGLEYNLFGTDEFLALCRAIGCEPLICVNAGDGTPEEAAAWVQYCNGSPDTPLGRLRAERGHPEPYRVKLWEVGNEIYGRWQVNWTTPGGNADRYLRFRAAMLKADPAIQLLACGAQGDLFGEWNRALLKTASGDAAGGERAHPIRCITDHILTGGGVNSGTDPVELYHAFMGQAVDVGAKYRRLRQMMLEAGIREPRWAITELQLFAHFQGKAEAGAKLTPATMPTPATISEALYLATIVHECIRLGDFVELFTHSATVNHGGGLRKTRERVWANPVHYGHVLGAAFFNATPVAVKLASGTFSTQRAYGYIPPLKDVPLLDALAALTADGESLVVMLVHRCATSGPVRVSLEIKDFAGAGEAEVLTLAGAAAHDQNTAEEPERIVPRRSTVAVEGAKATLTLAPFSLTRVTVRRK